MQYDNPNIAVTDKLPTPGEAVMVICQTFRCRGYVDNSGIWRYDSNDNPIEESVLAWAEFDA
jgi:hypothetical protein